MSRDMWWGSTSNCGEREGEREREHEVACVGKCTVLCAIVQPHYIDG